MPAMPMKTIATKLGPIGYDDQGESGQRVAILWPSLFTDHTMWNAQIRALRSAGWRTLALDPPGHGLSPGPDRTFTMEECTDVGVQMLQLVDEGVPAIMLGTSWGGMIAPRVARRCPGRLSALILFNTTADSPDFRTRMTSRLLTVLLAIKPLDRTVNQLLLSLQLSERTRTGKPQIGEALAAGFRSFQRRALIQAVDSVLVRRDSFYDHLAEVETPTLVLSGAQDTILPTAMSRRIAQRMPHARQVEVDGAAHLVPLEQPDAANRLILEFVKDLNGGRG